VTSKLTDCNRDPDAVSLVGKTDHAPAFLSDWKTDEETRPPVR
jgi:hypothetical protein